MTHSAPCCVCQRHSRNGWACGAAAMQALIKDRFVQVNAALEALHQTQRGWVVPDSALKAGLKDRIYSHFLPAYSVRDP